MKIWLIDDDSLTNMLNRMLIQDFNKEIQITEFEKAEDAIDALLKGDYPDIILLDINMPVMNGWDFLYEIEGRNIHLNDETSIHMLTSSVAPNDRELAEKSNLVKRFLIKPLTQDILREIIH
jgi:CheY-like chemotaxis protein